MAAHSPLRPFTTPSDTSNDRVVDLGGQAIHTFSFNAPLPLVFDYFTDIPSIFTFLPDVIDVHPYSPNTCRVIVGSSDIFGFNMAGIFDLEIVLDQDRSIHLIPANDGPAVRMKGFTFPGDLWIETTFEPYEEGTVVEFSLEVSLTIPLPGPLRKMPRPFVQQLGERAMEFKMSHMITGFVRHVEIDFERFARWSTTSDSIPTYHREEEN